MVNFKFAAIFLLVASVAAFFAGHSYSDNSWQAKWSEAEKTAAQNQLNAVNAEAEKHNKRIAELEKVRDEFKNKFAQAELDNRSAVDSGDSLQQSFADSLRESGSCDKPAPTVRELAAEATEATVQSYVFGSIVKEAVEYARIAEEAIVTGLSCEAEYNVLAGSISK